MKGLTIRAVAEACNGTFFGSEEVLEKEIDHVVIDSRKAEKDALFIAIKGERADGHSFIPQVFAAGAALVVSEKQLENPDGPYILVDSSEQALKQIAEYYRSTLDIPVIGVTGSVGKTSTKEMIASVLEQRFSVLKTEGNFNNEIGMPLTLLRIRSYHEVAVVEMGISDFGEMHRLAKIAKPDICVLTNIGQAHLENLKTRDGILKAKSEIFDFIKEDATIILNGNDDKLSMIHQVKGITPLRYFVEDGSAKRQADQCYQVIAEKIADHGLEGINMTLSFEDTAYSVREPIPGMHNVYNACAAALIARKLGLTKEEILRGISSVKTISGRTNILTLKNGITLIDDCYNANPISMKASIEVLANSSGRKIAVLGDMGELGEEEAELHREVGRFVAEKGIDVLYATGDLSGYMIEAAKGIECKRHFSTRKDLVAELSGILQEGDIVLIKASHFMEFDKIVSALQK